MNLKAAVATVTVVDVSARSTVGARRHSHPPDCARLLNKPGSGAAAGSRMNGPAVSRQPVHPGQLATGTPGSEFVYRHQHPAPGHAGERAMHERMLLARWLAARIRTGGDPIPAPRTALRPGYVTRLRGLGRRHEPLDEAADLSPHTRPRLTLGLSSPRRRAWVASGAQGTKRAFRFGAANAGYRTIPPSPLQPLLRVPR